VKPRAPWSNSGREADDNLTLIDKLLDEQQSLTAVERFARVHDRNELPALAQHYRRLLPATAPGPGQQYAFEVDLDKCSGCKACVTACHSLNGLDENETWRSVGLLVSDSTRNPKPKTRDSKPSYQQHVTTACHHCVEPACLSGCPVLAYDKDPVTGIVRHLDDQCIGCQYCVLKCPYEVPQYTKTRGIVRKCDMCSNRLDAGEAPACVQSCPHEAIRITLVQPAKVRGKYRPLQSFTFQSSRASATANTFLPASPNPAITLPTTRFVSAKPLRDNLFAGDDSVVRPSESHLPLVFLLTFSQLAVGASVAALFAGPTKGLLFAAFLMGAFALGVGSLHLGQPLKAWRAFLGWRQSWFSREVIAFGGYVLLAGMAAAAPWVNALKPFATWLMLVTAVTGLLGVACSAMIYVDTRREFWNAAQSFTRFIGTVVLLGAATALVFSPEPLFAVLMAGAAVGKLVFEHRIFRSLVDEESPGQSPLSKTARLLAGELGLAARGRVACALIGGVFLPTLYLLMPTAAPAAGALALCVGAELLERYLFFTAVVTQKMPGGFSA